MARGEVIIRRMYEPDLQAQLRALKVLLAAHRGKETARWMAGRRVQGE
jgi:hypothetical protein